MAGDDPSLNETVVTQNATNETLKITNFTSLVSLANVHSSSISGTGNPGDDITLSVSDGFSTVTGTPTTVAVDGTWSFSELDLSTLKDGSLAYQVKENDAAVLVDSQGANATKVTVAITSVTPLNQANSSAAIVSGTGDAGATVSVVATDGTTTIGPLTTTISEGGTWTIDSFDLHTLSDGTITFTATATDALSNSATDMFTATKDTVAPAVAVTSATNPIGSANQSAVSVGGTGDDGANISVTASDGTHTSNTVTTVVSGGTWSVSGIDVSGLDDGPVTFTATATDALQNHSASAAVSAKDTVAVTSFPATLGLANQHSITVSGTGEVGATIGLSITDGTHTINPSSTTVAADGTWSISSVDVSTLNDGPITYNATSTDLGSNVDMTSVTGAKVTVTVTPISFVNIANQNATTISGGGEAMPTISMTVTDSSTTLGPFTTTVGANGQWTINNLDLHTLADTTLTFNVTATDALSNSAQTSFNAIKDTVAPPIAFDAVTDPITAGNASSVAASGTGNSGDQISLKASDGSLTTSSADDNRRRRHLVDHEHRREWL